jgi:hypothetical protein
MQAKIQCALRILRGLNAHDVLEDMLYMNALGQPILVFNSLKPAAELLDRRASIYSSRPRFIMAHEVLSGGLFTAFLPYGDLCVCSFRLQIGANVSLIVGVVQDELATRASPSWQSAVITVFFARKAFFWLLLYWRNPML